MTDFGDSIAPRRIGSNASALAGVLTYDAHDLDKTNTATCNVAWYPAPLDREFCPLISNIVPFGNLFRAIVISWVYPLLIAVTACRFGGAWNI